MINDCCSHMSIFLILFYIESFRFISERLPSSGIYQQRYIGKQQTNVNLITTNKFNQLQEMVFQLNLSWSACKKTNYFFIMMNVSTSSDTSVELTVQIRQKGQEERVWNQIAWIQILALSLTPCDYGTLDRSLLSYCLSFLIFKMRVMLFSSEGNSKDSMS